MLLLQRETTAICSKQERKRERLAYDEPKAKKRIKGIGIKVNTTASMAHTALSVGLAPPEKEASRINQHVF